jgi:hypothetical protein
MKTTPSYDLKMMRMINQGRNIPFTSSEIAELPLGFTATAVYHTSKFDPKLSRFIPRNDPYQQSPKRK